MKPVFFLILVLSLIHACVPTYKDRITVTTTSAKSGSQDIVHIRSLYILARGNVSSRFVTTNLHSALDKMMQKNGSKSDFEFKSAMGAAQKTDIRKIPTDSYEGIMLLTARDTATIDYSETKYIYPLPIDFYGEKRGKAYEDIFIIELFNSQKQLIYKGEISFHFDPTKDALYSDAAEKLISQLEKSNIKLW